jgi:hypothetical protein
VSDAPRYEVCGRRCRFRRHAPVIRCRARLAPGSQA